jgi:hypothetical protein
MSCCESIKSELVSGAMGFIRNQEEKLAAKLLRWQYEKQKLPLPAEADLMTQKARIVDEAHRIARERGGNLLEIMKELVSDFFNKNR